ncbi:hypothetical protein E2562_007083 [Oryza meyeriana var. granulata]|uniref:Uncharacterized protein n=1 Tax=Oryza meyeriana var. granulata TaxID=110450 RepID=A0A6G1F4U2_9ORYZ|nr:hypothetical protein E2562_007083 [Oryza meyeriana var. granulata]
MVTKTMCTMTRTMVTTTMTTMILMRCTTQRWRWICTSELGAAQAAASEPQHSSIRPKILVEI